MHFLKWNVSKRGKWKLSHEGTPISLFKSFEVFVKKRRRLTLIVAPYPVMLHTLWNKVLENTNTYPYLKHNHKKFFKKTEKEYFLKHKLSTLWYFTHFGTRFSKTQTHNAPQNTTTKDFATCFLQSPISQWTIF